MPPVSKRQARYAFAHQNEKWAREMIDAMDSMKGLPERAGDRRRKHGKRKGGRRKEDRD